MCAAKANDRVEDEEEEEEEERGRTSRIPTNPPFVAYLGGLKPEVEGHHIQHFFDEFELINTSVENGIGKAEFRDRGALTRALFYSGRVLLGREVTVDVVPPSANAPMAQPAPSATNVHRSRSGGDGGRQQGGPQQGRGGPQGYDNRGGYRRGEGEQRGYDRRGDNRDRGAEPQPGRPERSSSMGSSGGEQEGTPEAKPAEGRKRLQLKPRTKPLDAPAPEPARNASIFGGGRPHDDLEYEKKRMEREGSKPGEEGSATTGGASEPTKHATDKAPHGRERSNSFSKKNDPAHRHRHDNHKDHHHDGKGSFFKKGAAPNGPNKGDHFNTKKPEPVKKPSSSSSSSVRKSKGPVDDDEWHEVDHHHGGSASKLVGKRVENKDVAVEEGQPRSVRNAFAALNMEDEESDGAESS